MFVGVADDPSDARKLGNLLRCPLRVASGNHDVAPGVMTMDTTNHLAHFGVGRSGNRAGIQDREVALLRAHNLFEACLNQLPFESGAICLAGPTSEIEKMKRSHEQNAILPESLPDLPGDCHQSRARVIVVVLATGKDAGNRAPAADS